MKAKPVAKAKAKRKPYQPRRYFSRDDMLGHVTGYMGTTHWNIGYVDSVRRNFGKLEHCMFYFRCIPRFETTAAPLVRYQIYDNGIPKAGGILGS